MDPLPEAITENMSVVVAGPISPGRVSLIVEKIRHTLPRAQIILSSWVSDGVTPELLSNLSGVRDVVLSEDPGGPVHDPLAGTETSIFRLLKAFNEAKELIVNPLTLRIRSDLEISSDRFLRAWTDANSFPHRENGIFKRKILILSCYTRFRFPAARGHWPAILHPSDWMHFGLTEDLESLFDIQPPDYGVSYSMYLERLWDELPKFAPYRGRANFQFPPEMWIGLESLKTPDHSSLQHWADQDNAIALEEISHKILVDNFVVLSPQAAGFRSHKHQGLTGNFPMNMDYAASVVTGVMYQRMLRRIYPQSRAERSVPRSIHDYWVETLRALYPLWRVYLYLRVLWRQEVPRRSR